MVTARLVAGTQVLITGCGSGLISEENSSSRREDEALTTPTDTSAVSAGNEADSNAANSNAVAGNGDSNADDENRPRDSQRVLNDSRPPLEPGFIRIANLSGSELLTTTLSYPLRENDYEYGEGAKFENLGTSQSSAYVQVSQPFRLVIIDVSTEDGLYSTGGVTDFLGEALRPGSYTYSVNLVQYDSPRTRGGVSYVGDVVYDYPSQPDTPSQ